MSETGEIDLNSLKRRFTEIKNVNIPPIREKLRTGDNRDSGSKISPAKKIRTSLPHITMNKMAIRKNSVDPPQQKEKSQYYGRPFLHYLEFQPLMI